MLKYEYHMEIKAKIQIFEEKIEEYYISCFPRPLQHYLQSAEGKASIAKWPLFTFNISKFYLQITEESSFPTELQSKCAEKLIDIKLLIAIC